MKRLTQHATLLLFLCFLLPTLSFSQDEVDTEDRNLSGFDQIISKGSADIYLTYGNKDEVLVERGFNVITKVENNVLIIKTLKGKSKRKIRVDGGDIDDPKPRRFRSFFGFGGSSKTPKIYVTIKKLTAITASGATDIYGQNLFQLEDLYIKCSGASDLKLEIKANKLVCDLSGASDIKLSGNAKTLSVNASGASDFKSRNLTVKTCDAKASGASDIYVFVEKELTYRTSGASDMHYEGNPTVTNLKSKKRYNRP